MNIEQNKKFVNQIWDDSIIPTLQEYIKIPNKSPAFDPEWKKNGYMDQAMQLISNWCQQHAIPGMKLEVIQSAGRTPILFVEIPGAKDEEISELRRPGDRAHRRVPPRHPPRGNKIRFLSNLRPLPRSP